MDTADIRRIHTSKLVAREFRGFKTTGILDFFDKVAWGSPLILKGPKGAGKTLNIEQWAFTRKIPFLRKSCTADTSDRQLLGSHTLKSFDESFFTLGCLAASIDVANEAGYCLLVLEEINALNEEAQKAVNSAADYRREVDLPHVGEVFRLRPEVLAPFNGTVVEIEPLDDYQSNLVVIAKDDTAPPLEVRVPTRSVNARVTHGAAVTAGQLLVRQAQLWIVGTMNPGYGGTYDLNEDFRSRFQFVEMDYMPDDTEKEILLKKFPTAATAEEQVFVGGLQTFAKESRGGKYGYGLGTRDLEQCIEKYIQLGSRERALKMLEGKFDAQFITDFRARIKSVFHIDVTTVSPWS